MSVTLFMKTDFEPGSFLQNVEPSASVSYECCSQNLTSDNVFCSRPCVYLPTLSQYSVAVRCCPVNFTLRPLESTPLFDLPYRIVFAVATQSSVLLYDTQHAAPFALISNIHYTRLTDLSW